ncbi:MAG: substrate-binding domain-containing protein [Lachnospiraceae bacterium]|nr:substrate-binding domain-containing protein [Lachnospiraceae bacterium]
MRNKEIIKNNNEIKIILFLIVILLIIIGLFIRAQLVLKNSSLDEKIYQYHYAFISRSEDSYTANHIYEEAKNYGKRYGVYVEMLRGREDINYTISDYVKMAKAMKVDGVIMEASDDPVIKESINDAAADGIPIITLLKDCPESDRISFMELGDYNLGRRYGRIIIDITKTRSPKVMVLVDDTAVDDIELIMNGLKETLKNEGNHLDVDIVKQEVDGSLNFRLMNKVNDILANDENRPDIILCLNERDTQIVHQTISDYGLSGKAMIIGTGISEILLKAVKDDEFAALVDADSSQAGMMCIDAMMNYTKNGNIEDHIIVDETVVTKDNVERYLNEE